MKILIIIFLLAPLLCFAAPPQGDFVGSRTCSFEGTFYIFNLTKTALEKSPKWNPDKSEFPSMSPKQAQVSALKQITKLLPGYQQHMHIYTITLEALYDTVWVYLVTYDYFPPNGSTGPPRRFTVPVYFDGSTITPEIRVVNQSSS